MNMTVTNKDAKIIYSKYWYKTGPGGIMFPTIYIDEYWDYTIDLFGFREDWETFLEKFNKEFTSAKQYITELNAILNTLYETLFLPDTPERIRQFTYNSNLGEQKIKEIHLYDRPEGEYWYIDLHSAYTQCLKYMGVMKPDVTYEDVLNKLTSSELLKNKNTRLRLYWMFIHDRCIFSAICDKLLYDILTSQEFKNKFSFDIKDVFGNFGDCIFIPKNKASLKEGDYEIDGISFSIGTYTIKSASYRNQTIKYFDEYKIPSFFKNEYYCISTDEYLCVMKAIKNQQINQIDLTVGFEEQIFYVMDYVVEPPLRPS